MVGMLDAIKTLNAPLGFGKAFFDLALEFPQAASWKSTAKKIAFVKGFGQTTILGFKLDHIRKAYFEGKTFEMTQLGIGAVRDGCKSTKWLATSLSLIPLNEVWSWRLGTICSMTQTIGAI